MTNSNWKPVPHDQLPCPFCGSNADPTGWLCNDGSRGPECEGCGATAESMEAWNSRAAPVQPAAEPDDYESLKQCSAAWRVVVDALFRHGPTGWLDKNKPAMYCAAEAIEELAAAAQPVAVPDWRIPAAEWLNKKSDAQAAINAKHLRYVEYYPEWVQAERALRWYAEEILAARQPSAQVPDDAMIGAGVAALQRFRNGGHAEDCVREIFSAMLSAAARKGEV